MSNAIIAALARLVDREMRLGSTLPEGDILERAVTKAKRGSGNSGKLTLSGSTAANNFFGVASIFPSPTGNVSFQIENLPPDVYTIHLAVVNPPALSTATPFVLSTIADAVFAVDGRQNRRLVSVNQGIRICGQADAISVNIKDNSVPAIAARIPVCFEYQVSIAISRGLRPDLSQPPTLAPFDANGLVFPPFEMDLAAGTSLSIPVPQGVGIISTNTTVWVTPGGGVIPEGAAEVAYRNNGTILRVFDPRVAPWVPIVPGTNEVFIKNNTGAQDIQFSVLFGIDG